MRAAARDPAATHPEEPISKTDEKALEQVQLAMGGRLDPSWGKPLVTNLQSFATHFTLSADEVRRFFTSRGIENLDLP